MTNRNSPLDHTLYGHGGKDFPYLLRDRFADWRNGRKDGMNKDPEPTAQDLRTDYWRQLDNRANYLYINERSLLLPRVEEHISRCSVVMAEYQHLNDELAVLVLEITESQKRLYASRQDFDDHDRRPDTSQAQKAAALMRFRQAQKEHDRLIKHQSDVTEGRNALEKEEAALRARIPIEVQRLNDQLWRIYHHVARRHSHYRKFLVRTHPHGSHIRQRLADYNPPSPPTVSHRMDAGGQWQLGGTNTDNTQE
jgi:hypothetical protein